MKFSGSPSTTVLMDLFSLSFSSLAFLTAGGVSSSSPSFSRGSVLGANSCRRGFLFRTSLAPDPEALLALFSLGLLELAELLAPLFLTFLLAPPPFFSVPFPLTSLLLPLSMGIEEGQSRAEHRARSPAFEFKLSLPCLGFQVQTHTTLKPQLRTCQPKRQRKEKQFNRNFT